MTTNNEITFKDHLVQHPNRYKQVQVAPGVVDLVPTWQENPSEIVQIGTAVDRQLFEKLKGNVTRRSETFTAVDGQTVFDLERAYLVEQGRLDVYVSGVKQRSGVDFSETSPTRFTLSSPLSVGDTVEAVYFTANQAMAEDLIEQVQAAEAATSAAVSATDEAIDAAAEARSTALNWKEPVNNFAALASLPAAQIRDTRMARDTGKVYRYDGAVWAEIQDIDPTAINALDTRLTSQLAETAQAVGLSSSSYATLQEAINDAIATGKSLVISGPHTINTRLLINAPVTIVFANNAFFTQTQFAYPVFEVRSANVKFIGKLRAENTGATFHVTPTEITNRGLSVPVEVQGDPKGYSAVIACIQNVNDLYVEHVEGKNFVNTLSFLSNVSSDVNYSKGVKVDYAYGENQWCTVLGGGFKDASFGEIVGRGMVKSQGANPDHVLYIGTRAAAPDHRILIDRVVGYDSPNMSYIAQVKTTLKIVINEVVGYNCPHALNFGEGCPEAFVGSVKGNYNEPVSDFDHIVKADTGSKVVVETVDLVTSRTHPGTLAAVLGVVGTGTDLSVTSAKIKVASASNPIKAIRSTATLRVDYLSLEYTTAPTAQPILVEAGRLYIYNPPVVQGTGNLLFQATAAVDYYLMFDPNVFGGVCDDTTISINNNDFSKLNFRSFDKSPTEQAGNITSYNLRARNVLKLKNGGATINTLSRGAQMQQYMLVAGADGTCPAIAHGTGNIFLKSGTNYAANSWKVLRFTCVDDKFYEV